MSVQPPSPTPAQSRSNRTTVIVLVVIAVILAVIAALLLQNVARHRQGAAATSQAATSTTSAAAATTVPEPTPAPPVPDAQTLELIRSETHRDPADAQAKGKVDAPVVMVVYSDFACPYCTQFAQKVEPELADLVAQGTLRVEWRDLAQISPTSPLAAQAGRAAAKQGKFWEFHDAVYAAADPQGHPEYTEDSLVGFAQKAGVPDIERFRTDMNDSATVTAVEEATQHARDINIQGTPFLIVNEAVINGYRPADYVRNTITEQAARAS